VDKAKPFDIPKREVWEAFKRVKANQGAAVLSRNGLEFDGAVSGRMRIRGQAARSIGLAASFWFRVCHPSTLRMVI
jgi:hypothetical protein